MVTERATVHDCTLPAVVWLFHSLCSIPGEAAAQDEGRFRGAVLSAQSVGAMLLRALLL